MSMQWWYPIAGVGLAGFGGLIAYAEYKLTHAKQRTAKRKRDNYYGID